MGYKILVSTRRGGVTLLGRRTFKTRANAQRKIANVRQRQIRYHVKPSNRIGHTQVIKVGRR